MSSRALPIHPGATAAPQRQIRLSFSPAEAPAPVNPLALFDLAVKSEPAIAAHADTLFVAGEEGLRASLAFLPDRTGIIEYTAKTRLFKRP
jgi:hypothetical protein